MGTGGLGRGVGGVGRVGCVVGCSVGDGVGSGVGVPGAVAPVGSGDDGPAEGPGAATGLEGEGAGAGGAPGPVAVGAGLLVPTSWVAPGPGEPTTWTPRPGVPDGPGDPVEPVAGSAGPPARIVITATASNPPPATPAACRT